MLDSKWEKYGKKGLVVIGVTDEDPALVDAWMAKHEPEYPIAVLANNSFERAIGVPGFPYAAVIAPGGKLSYAGFVNGLSDPVDAALEEATAGPLFPKVLSKAVKLYNQGKFGDSYGEVREQLEDGVDDEDRDAVESFRAQLERQAEAALAGGRARFEDGFVLEALQRVEAYAESKTPFPVTPDCAALVAELEALPDFKKELKGGEAYADALALRREREYTDAAKAYRGVWRKYKGTLIGERAFEAARDIIGKGWCGFQSTCPKCRQAKRACSRHAEEVKL